MGQKNIQFLCENQTISSPKIFDARITHELKFICVDKEKIHNISEDIHYVILNRENLS